MTIFVDSPQPARAYSLHLSKEHQQEAGQMKTYAQHSDDDAARAMRFQKQAKEAIDKGLTKKADRLIEKADAIFSRLTD